MAIVRFDWKEMPPANCRGGAVSFGNFDGVHRGHAALLHRLIERSRALRIPSLAVTFDPHPLQLLRPEQFQPVLTTVADRAELIHSLGVDHVLILQTTPELLQLSVELTDANAAIFDAAHDFSGCIAGIHEVLHRQGLLEGIWCLDPKEGLSPGQAEEIDRVCRAYPHLNDNAFVEAHRDEWLA